MMPTIRITSPEGKVIKITAPEGATPEQIQQVAGDYIKSMAPPAPSPVAAAPQQPPAPPQQAQAAPPMQPQGPAPAQPQQPAPAPTPGAMQQAAPPQMAQQPPQAMPPAEPPAGGPPGAPSLPQQLMQRGGRGFQPPESPMDYGIREGLAGAGRGVRQVFNKLTDDEEYQQLLDAEPAKRKEWEAGRPKEDGTLDYLAGGAGRIVGENLPYAAIPAGAGMGLLARLGIGAATGAASGYAQPLTREQDERGQRGANAVLGGVAGAAAPAAASGLGWGLGKLTQRGKYAPVDDALRGFARDEIGIDRGGDVLPAYKAVKGKLDDTVDSLRNQAKSRYSMIEDNPALPSVRLNEASKRASVDAANLPQEVVSALNPKARKVVEGLRRGSTRDTGIVNARGENIEVPDNASYAEVRETIRQLRRERRRGEINPNSAASSNTGLLRSLEESLQNDVDNWGRGNPDLKDTIREAKEVDKWYAETVVPFQNKKTELGKYSMSEGAEKDLAKMLKKDSGGAIGELISRTGGDPEMISNLRKIKMKEVLDQTTASSKVKALEGGTSRNALFDPSQREYLDTLAQALRSGGSQGGLGSMAGTLAGGKLGAIINIGRSFMPEQKVLKYGEKATGKEARRALINMLLRVPSQEAAVTDSGD